MGLAVNERIVVGSSSAQPVCLPVSQAGIGFDLLETAGPIKLSCRFSALPWDGLAKLRFKISGGGFHAQALPMAPCENGGCFLGHFAGQVCQSFCDAGDRVAMARRDVDVASARRDFSDKSLTCQWRLG